VYLEIQSTDYWHALCSMQQQLRSHNVDSEHKSLSTRFQNKTKIN